MRVTRCANAGAAEFPPDRSSRDAAISGDHLERRRSHPDPVRDLRALEAPGHDVSRKCPSRCPADVWRFTEVKPTKPLAEVVAAEAVENPRNTDVRRDREQVTEV